MEKIHLPTKLGNNLLIYAASHANTKEVCQLLEDQEADVNTRNINGATPLHFAVYYEHPEVVQVLLQFGADPNIQEYQDVGQYSPLHRAVERNNYEICQILLQNGANPTKKAKNGFTSLHIAAKMGFIDLVSLLLENGSDPNARDEQGFTAEFWAEYNKNYEITAAIKKFAEENQIKLIKSSVSLDEYKEYRYAIRQINNIQPKKSKKSKKGNKKSK